MAKITGKEGLTFSGKAIVFESEETALAAILGTGGSGSGHVIVIRNEGPVGGPGMREMLAPTSAVIGRGLGATVGLITDGRFSGGSHGFVVGPMSRPRLPWEAPPPPSCETGIRSRSMLSTTA